MRSRYNTNGRPNLQQTKYSTAVIFHFVLHYIVHNEITTFSPCTVRYCVKIMELQLVKTIILPPSLMASAGSVTDQQNNFLTSSVFVGRCWIHRTLHERRHSAALCSVFQIVLIQISKKAPWKRLKILLASLKTKQKK